MGLFDVFNGRIEYFNSIVVPVLNNIFSKIKELPDGTEKEVFTKSLVIAQLGVDLFFKPGQGPAIKDIKKYNQYHFEQLYAFFMIWMSYDFSNASVIREEEIKGKLKSILGIREDELDHYLEQLKYGDKTPMGLDKLWEEVVKVIHTMPNTQENYAVFAREFSKICRVSLQ